MRLQVWVKNSHRLPIISRRILHSKWWILRSPMPTEHPESHYKSRRILGADKWGKNFSPSGSREFPSFWNLYSKSTVVQTLLQCGWWNFSPLPLPAEIIKTEFFSILDIHLRVSLTLTLLRSQFWRRHPKLLPTNSCWESNHIPFPLCLQSNEQTNHVYETRQYMSHRALGTEHTSQFSTN